MGTREDLCQRYLEAVKERDEAWSDGKRVEQRHSTGEGIRFVRVEHPEVQEAWERTRKAENKVAELRRQLIECLTWSDTLEIAPADSDLSRGDASSSTCVWQCPPRKSTTPSCGSTRAKRYGHAPPHTTTPKSLSLPRRRSPSGYGMHSAKARNSWASKARPGGVHCIVRSSPQNATEPYWNRTPTFGAKPNVNLKSGTASSHQHGSIFETGGKQVINCQTRGHPVNLSVFHYIFRKHLTISHGASLIAVTT